MSFDPFPSDRIDLVITLSIVMIVAFIFTIWIYYRWKQKGNIVTKYLFLTYFYYFSSILFNFIGILDGYISGYRQWLYRVTIGISLGWTLIAMSYFLRFFGEIFELNKPNLKKYINITYLIALLVILPNNYYGVPVGEDTYFGPNIRLFSNSLLALWTLIVHLNIAYKLFHAIPKLEEKHAKFSFIFIGLSQIVMVLMFVFVIIDVLIFTFTENVDGYSIFYSIAWICAAIFEILCFCGYVLPAYLKFEK